MSFCRLPFPVDSALGLTKGSQFHEVPDIVYFIACVIGVLVRKLFPVPMCLGLFLMLSGSAYCVENFDALVLEFCAG